MENKSIPSAVDVSQDSWETRIRNASVFVGMEPTEIETILKEFGVEREPAGLEMLSDEEVTPFGDLRRLFCEDRGVPVPKLRMAMKYLRGPADSKKTDSIDPDLLDLQKKFGVKMKLADYGVDVLIPEYKPSNPNHPITRELKRRYGNKAIIAFRPDTSIIAVEETINYITDIETGYPEEEAIIVDSELVTLQPIGILPDQLVDEDPLFAGRPLKRGRSIINRINWESVPETARQFCRLVVEAGEIDVDNRLNVRELVQTAVGGIEALKEIYPEIGREFRERKQTNDLPHLKMRMGSYDKAVQNPFGIKNGNRRY